MYMRVERTIPAASADGSPLPIRGAPGIEGSIDHASGVVKAPWWLRSTHCTVTATLARATCLLPVVGDSNAATVVLPYAATVTARACEPLIPMDVNASCVPRGETGRVEGGDKASAERVRLWWFPPLSVGVSILDKESVRAALPAARWVLETDSVPERLL